MAEENNKRHWINFDLPEETDVVTVIREILQRNGLAESSEEFFEKRSQNKDSRLIIVRDAARLLVEKKIPEKKLAEFLAKHLPAKEHVAEKIIKEVKEELLPYAKIIDEEQEEKETEAEEKKREAEVNRQRAEKQKEQEETYDKESFREELLQKIGQGRTASSFEIPTPPLPPGAKSPATKNVEENAARTQKEKPGLPSQPSPSPQQKEGEPPEKKDFPRASQYKEEDPYRETPQ